MRAVAFTEGVAEAIKAGDEDEGAKPGGARRRQRGSGAAGGTGRGGPAAEGALPGRREDAPLPEISRSDNPAAWPLVQRVLQGETDELGDKYAQIVETSEGFVLYTAGPIYADGELVGVVLVGTALDSFCQAGEDEGAGGRHDLRLRWQRPWPRPSPGPTTASAGEARLDIGGDVLDGATAGATVREHRTLWGRDYDLLYGRLEVAGPGGGALLRRPAHRLHLQRRHRHPHADGALFGVGMAAVLAIGFFLARLLTQPILRLVRTARLVDLRRPERAQRRQVRRRDRHPRLVVR